MDQIAAAVFGVAGYDWPAERQETLDSIATLGLLSPVEVYNDASLGLVAGSPSGWGVVVVSGTGCNCRGWDSQRQREGKMTGTGRRFGEGAGALELIAKAVEVVAAAWSMRGPSTNLSRVLVEYCGCPDLDRLIEALALEQVSIPPEAVKVIFETAAEGDPMAIALLQWAGEKLGELANGVIRQLRFERLEFDVVLAGSMFEGSPLLAERVGEAVHLLAPGARLRRLSAPPVIGAVLLAMESAGLSPDLTVRRNLCQPLR